MITRELAASQAGDSGRIGVLLWSSFVICFLCNVCAGLISTLMATYLPPVVQELTGRSGSEELGTISAYIQSIYIAGWAVGGFFWGFVSDKIGRVKALSLSVASFGLCTLIISVAPSWEYVVLLRLFSGLAVGGILVVTPMLLFEIWPPKTRAVMIGIDSIGFPVGIFSSGLVTFLVANWRDAFLIGLAPLVLGIIGLYTLKESDQWKSRATSSSDKDRKSTRLNSSHVKISYAVFCLKKKKL